MKLLKLFVAGSLIASTSTLVWAGKNGPIDQENLPPKHSTNIVNKPDMNDGQSTGGKHKTHKRKSKKKRDAEKRRAEKTTLRTAKNIRKIPLKEKEISHDTEKEKALSVQEEGSHTLQSSTPTITEDFSLLDGHMKSLLQKLEAAHKEVDVKEILKAYENFASLEFSAEVWKAYRLRQGIYQWPRQDDKQAVGSKLFLPKWTYEWADSFEQKDLLKRKDMVQAFAIGAKLNDPVSLYYFVDTFQAIRKEFSFKDILPELLYQFYQQAFKDLEQCTDHPDACYILGWNAWNYPYLRKFKPEESFNLHVKGGDLRNRFKALEIRECHGGKGKSRLEKATFEDYLEVAREGYGPAYLRAAELVTDPETKVSILKEAIKKGYAPAFIKLGRLYNTKKDIEEKRKYYEAGAQAGISEGYVVLGRTYVGDVTSITQEEAEALSEEQIEKAEHFFRLAGEAQDPSGWDHLAQLYSVLLPNEQIAKEKRLSYCRNMYDALIKGISLGSAEAYRTAAVYFSESLPGLIEVYGYSPRNSRTYQMFVDFIKNKD